MGAPAAPAAVSLTLPGQAYVVLPANAASFALPYPVLSTLESVPATATATSPPSAIAGARGGSGIGATLPGSPERHGVYKPLTAR